MVEQVALATQNDLRRLRVAAWTRELLAGRSGAIGGRNLTVPKTRQRVLWGVVDSHYHPAFTSSALMSLNRLNQRLPKRFRGVICLD